MPTPARPAPRMAVVADGAGRGSMQAVGAGGAPEGPVVDVGDLAGAIGDIERRERPRWVWADTTDVYPAVLASGGRIARSHDLALTEGLLSGMAGRAGEPRSLAAALARLEGRPFIEERRGGPPVSRDQGVLFDPGGHQPPASAPPDGAAALEAVVAVHRDQLRRIDALHHAARARLLVAAESAAGLAAAEMTADGLPWRSDIHDRLLTEMLGPRPAPGARPARVEALGRRIGELLAVPDLNADSPGQVIRAFALAGVTITSTRSTVLQAVDHPAAPVLLEYKELARLYSAYGWSWDETWAGSGRLRPDYVVGGVVSGRWATRGGGGLQVPRILRGAVVADPGWVLVVADAGQLEPRLLAAISGDPALGAIAGAPGDLYAAVATVAFAGDRGAAKLALLGAMYGATTGTAGQQLAGLRRRFGAAMGLLEEAARAGERGDTVSSHLGRTCPPPPSDWWEDVDGPTAWAQQAGPGPGARSPRARARGRFTRNFVVQATASNWASVWIAGLRRRLGSVLPGAVPPGSVPPDGPVAAGHDVRGRPHLALFQHDEVLVHCRRGDADEVRAAVVAAGGEATRRLFPDSPVTIPLETTTVVSYADAKG